MPKLMLRSVGRENAPKGTVAPAGTPIELVDLDAAALREWPPYARKGVALYRARAKAFLEPRRKPKPLPTSATAEPQPATAKGVAPRKKAT